jgi:hypothetical protein
MSDEQYAELRGELISIRTHLNGIGVQILASTVVILIVVGVVGMILSYGNH